MSFTKGYTASMVARKDLEHKGLLGAENGIGNGLIAGAKIFKDVDEEYVSSRTRLEQVLADIVGENEAEASFFAMDVAEVYKQYDQWIKLLPKIKPFYAVKCNPDPVVLRILAELGTGFDCASRNEMDMVLSIGVSPDRIIYAHPCKPSSHLSYATRQGVRLMTFDNADELRKIRRLAPDAQAVLRVSTDDSSALCQLSLKFGARMESTQTLLETAKELGVNVVGVSFHVGSGCTDPNAYSDAVRRARVVFDQARELGMDLWLLDVGGGFSGSKQRDGMPFPQVAAGLSVAVDEYFSEFPSVQVIAEPGRYFAASAFTLAVNVTSKRQIVKEVEESQNQVVNSQKNYMYYINDGVYGSFNCIMFDHQKVYPEVLVCNTAFVYTAQGLRATETLPKYLSSIWGPTCDSIDCVVENVELPELFVGDWLVFNNLGAYSVCAASKFNGFETSRVYYFRSS
ncbi:Antizyme inhibitor 2 [Zancudomyces culisetae]|uniref:ornithine decarboxylase n=1 Tax=Zancudomyces culisetae TaxID=1213189 RepID=A0A1R1PJN4_ZANCU|nr:Antizyme inhibitor 2 [Zancudomyces culisetae]|eukprot:OMH81178.1 Antizyme inhibitor 2 [Zancudomyces culisetae]